MAAEKRIVKVCIGQLEKPMTRDHAHRFEGGGEVVVPYDVVVNVANKLLGAEQYERFMGELDHASHSLKIK